MNSSVRSAIFMLKPFSSQLAVIGKSLLCLNSCCVGASSLIALHVIELNRADFNLNVDISFVAIY